MSVLILLNCTFKASYSLKLHQLDYCDHAFSVIRCPSFVNFLHFRLLWNLTGSKNTTSSIIFVIFGLIGKQDGRPDWLRHFRSLLWNRWTELAEIRKRKGKRSDAVVWQTSLNDRQYIGEITRRRFKNFRFHNNYGPILDGQLGWQQLSNRCG